MGKIFLVCPNCKTRLSFPEVPNYQERIVDCPICHFKAKANVYQSGTLGQGGLGSNDDATQMPYAMIQRNQNVGQIRVTTTNQCYRLKIGVNTIGRLAQSSNADIQITNDEYMSRCHLQIDVVKTDYGIEHRLVEINSKNIVILNDNPIQRGDILKLQFGDKLTLGRTDIYLEEADGRSL